jgi:hypothetical protein
MRTDAGAEADSALEVVPGVEPRAAWRVRDIRILEHGLLEVRFVDGTQGLADLRPFLAGESAGGRMFAPLREEAVFRQAAVHLGTIEWPDEIDLPPDAMYEAIRAEGTWTLG